MQASKFTLFRLQLHRSPQLPLLGEYLTEPQIITLALEERPRDFIKGDDWLIGNVQRPYDDVMTFDIGRQHAATLTTVSESGDFHDLKALVAPHTNVVVDLKYQVAAIAHHSELSQSVYAIGARLQNLLQASTSVSERGIDVRVDALLDPAEFFEIIDNAAAVTKFKVTFGLPNVWDPAEFQRSMQVTTKELGGEESDTVIKGDHLNKEPLKQLARAASSIGKDAVAWVKKSAGQKAVSVRQGKNPVTVELTADDADAGQPEIDGDFDFTAEDDDVGQDVPSQSMRLLELLIERIRAKYAEIRRYD